MPLGYGGYGDFDYNSYEDALMELAGIQRKQQQTGPVDFLKMLGPLVQQIMQTRYNVQQQQWQRGIAEQELAQKDRYYDMMGGYYDYLKQPKPFEPNTELEWYLYRNPGKTQEDFYRMKERIKAEFREPGTGESTAAEKNYQREIQEHLWYLQQQQGDYGPPTPAKILRDRARKMAYEGKYQAAKQTTAAPKLPQITGFENAIQQAEGKTKRNFQILRSKAIRNQFKTQGLVYNTEEEDKLIAQVRANPDREVDWALAQKNYPNLDWGYIWEQLGR